MLHKGSYGPYYYECYYYLTLWVLNGTWAVPPLQLPESGKRNPKRGSALSKSPLSQWTTGLNPEPLGSPGLPYRPVLTEAAPRPAPLPPSPPPHLRPRIHPSRPQPGALTLRLGITLRFDQEQPAQRGQEQLEPHGPGLGTSGVSSGARSQAGNFPTGPAIPLPRTGPAPGAVSRRAAGGKGFLQTRPNPRPLRVRAAPCGPVPAAPGSFRRRPPPSLLRGLHSDRKEEGRRGRGNNFYTPDPAPSLDGNQ